MQVNNMKHLIWCAAAAALAFSCASPNRGVSSDSFVVEGSAPALNPGDTLYIADQTRAGFQILDTAVLDDDKCFRFVSSTDEPYVSGILCRQDIYHPLLVANGIYTKVDVPVEDDSLLVIVEGADNMAYYQLLRSQFAAMASIQPLYEKLTNPNTPPAEAEEAEAKLNEISNSLRGEVVDVMKANIPSAVSDIILQQLFRDLDDEQLKEILSLMESNPSPYAGHKEVQEAFLKKQETAVGKSFIDFTLTDVNGSEVALSSIVKANKLTLVDFWASWCGPCKAEMPNVVEAYAKFKNKGLEVVGVSLDQDPARWRNAIESWQMPWVHLSSLKAWACPAAQAYAVDAIPASVLIDANGIIVAKNLRGEELISTLSDMLK